MSKTPQDIEILKQIDAYLKGRLTDKEIEELWITFMKHPEYLELMETEAALKAIYEERKTRDQNSSTDRVEEYDSKKVVNFKWLTGLTAAAVIAVLVSFLFFLDRGEKITGSILALNNIPESQVENAEVVRDKSADIPEIDSLLNEGMREMMNNNISKAEQIYRKIISRYEAEPSLAMAYLNLGIIEYNLGEYRNAIEQFKHALSIENVNILVSEKAYWYMGNAYLNLEQWRQARKHVQEAYSMQGVFRNPAGNLLEKLDQHLSDNK